MSELTSPADLEAEAAVVGCAVAFDFGYRLAAGRLSPSAFYRTLHADLLRACGTPEMRSIEGHPAADLNDRYRPAGCADCVMYSTDMAGDRYATEAGCRRCGPLAGFPRSTVARMVRAAQLAAVDLHEVVRLVSDRPVQHDIAGTYAGRVVAAWRTREAMRALAEAYNALGAGQPLDSVRQPALAALGVP